MRRPRETLADEYEHLAEEAGQRMATAANLVPEKNPHLQMLANTIRNLGKPVTLTAIVGGKHLDAPVA